MPPMGITVGFCLAIIWTNFIGGLLAGLGLALIAYVFWHHRHEKSHEEETQKALEQKLESEAVLEDLDLGILAYSLDGKLILCNETTERFLGDKSKIATITDFLELFPDQKGITSAIFLGGTEEDRTITVRLGDKSYRLRVSDSLKPDGSKLATLIRLQDVTELERQDLQRKEFVANVSHELKTPLTTIKSYSESLLEWGLEEKDSQGIRRDVERIFEDVLRMEQLVADLLLLSTLDNKAQRPPMEEIDAKMLVQKVVDNFQRQAEDKEIDLNLVILSRVPPLFCDRSSIERILNNLVANALKYTKEGGKVTVYLSSVLDEVNFKVADTGLGIAPEHLPHLFERFYRVDSTGSRRYGGTGLGLAIAKELTKLHEGKLLVSSVLGKGTEFTLVLPSAGKVYRQCFRFAREGQTIEDSSLYESAEHELLLQAHDFGFTADSLAGLSLEAEAELMAQYEIIQTSPFEGEADAEDPKKDLSLVDDSPALDETDVPPASEDD